MYFFLLRRCGFRSDLDPRSSFDQTNKAVWWAWAGEEGIGGICMQDREELSYPAEVEAAKLQNALSGCPRLTNIVWLLLLLWELLLYS